MENIQNRRLCCRCPKFKPVGTICILFIALSLIFSAFSCGTLQSSIKQETVALQIKEPESLKKLKASHPADDKRPSVDRPAVASTEQDTDKKAMAQKAMKLQMPFIANEGQTADDVRFYAQTFGGTAYVTNKGEIVYSFLQKDKKKREDIKHGNRGPRHSDETKGWSLKESLVGAMAAEPQGKDQVSSTVNYFIGKDKSQWKTNIPAYNTVSLGRVYEGIDLSLKAYGKKVEKIFTVWPGGDPKSIKMKLEGADSLNITEQGELEMGTGLGTLRFSKPLAYQEKDGKRVNVEVAYYINKDKYGFKAENYDRTLPLMIDPYMLSYSTLLSGSGDSADYSYYIEIDGSGNAYICGETSTPGFPTSTGAYDNYFRGGWDVFVTKMNSDGSDIIYSTFLGGSSDDFSMGFALDSSGNAYVTGYTDSNDFSITLGAYDTSYNGLNDGFVSKLNPTGTDLVYSTFLGGEGETDDYGNNIAVDASGNAYVIGSTDSFDFPTTPGAYDNTYGGDEDAFVVKLNPTGSDLVFSTFLGGSLLDCPDGIEVDTTGNVYIAGCTTSSDFPTTPGAYDNTLGGTWDAFVAKMNPDGSDLIYSTFLGGDIGTANEYACRITVDASGNAYVSGGTTSSDFPTTSSAFDNTYGNWDGFVTKLNPTGTDLVYSTFIGGDSEWDECRGIEVDTSGNAYVVGSTMADDFPTTTGAYDETFGGTSGMADGFVIKLNPTGTDLVYSTFLGGNGETDDYCNGISVDASGNVYVAGFTDSNDFPTTTGAYDTFYGGDTDAFVIKLNSTGSDLVYSTYLGGDRTAAFGHHISVDSTGNAYVTGVTTARDFPTSTGAYDNIHNGDDNTFYAERDVFVTKINSNGSDIIYSTFIGGGSEDSSWGIAVDTAGNAYIGGTTKSNNFPTTPGAYDSTLGGFRDIFLSKLNPSGSDLVYSTLLGGELSDYCYSLAIDASGNVYIGGETDSSDFPTTPGAYDTTYDASDGFVTKINSTGTGLIYSTFLAGAFSDGIAIDMDGNAYLTGNANDELPTTPGAYDTSCGWGDCFVAKLNPNGSDLVFSTFLGGELDADECYGIAVDGSGNAYVSGHTWSSDFPTTPGAYDDSYNGDVDVFVSKLNPTGSELVYSTFIAGSSDEECYGIAVDNSGNAYIAGHTWSSDFPTTPDATDDTWNGQYDVFMSILNPLGSGLVYSTFLGGSDSDHENGIAINTKNKVYVTGYTESNDFPTTTGAFDETFVESYDAFVVMFERPDSDGDGMPDDWETANGLDPGTNDADDDLDGDGLINIDEYNNNTYANDPDSDDDGYNDMREVAKGTDPLLDTDYAGVPDTEWEALVDLYNSTNGASWTDSTNWLDDSVDEDEWYGVTCVDNHVTEIYLPNNNLDGTIPVSIDNLAFLAQLNLNNNQISGTIPSELGNLTNLQGLSLHLTQISGTIPPEIGNLTNLQDLNLHLTQISGTIPPEIGNLTNLQTLSLYDTQISGTIPSEIGNLTNLTIIYLSRTQISELFHPELGNLTNLGYLHLSGTQISGEIPPELGNCANLKNLSLSTPSYRVQYRQSWGTLQV